MKILITGIHGFIASALKKYIEEQCPSDQVFGTSRLRNSPHSGIFSCNLQDKKALFRILSQIRPEYVFHMAGGRQPTPEEIFESNFLTTRVLLETIGKVSRYRPRIIIPGTAAEYGKIDSRNGRVSEDVPARPISWYGFVKHMQTNLGLKYAKRGMNIVIARMFNISGAGVPSTLVVGNFVREISLIEKGRKKSIIRTKNLSGKRDFLDISDITAALFALAKDGQPGQVYNVCSGNAYSIRDVLLTLVRLSEKKNIKIQEDKENSSESFDVIGSNRKIRQAMSWKPRCPIDQSLTESLNYYRSRC